MITPFEPIVTDTARYSTKEASYILGIHPNTLLRHAKEGYIRFGIRKSSKRKFYTGYEIKRYWKAQC